MFTKNLVPKIEPKMLSANQIARFLNQLFLQNKSMKQCHLLHVDTTSQNLKVSQKIVGCPWSKMGGVNLVSAL